MKLIKAYLSALAKWKRWDGRTRRRDYWLFNLAHLIVNLVLFALLFVWTDNAAFHIISIFLFGAYTLVTIVPSIAVTIRRLHDIDKSGYYYFVQLVPVIGTIWFIILMSFRGDYGPNKYGPDPKADFYETGIDK